jgi:hypothetical protein
VLLVRNCNVDESTQDSELAPVFRHIIEDNLRPEQKDVLHDFLKHLKMYYLFNFSVHEKRETLDDKKNLMSQLGTVLLLPKRNARIYVDNACVALDCLTFCNETIFGTHQSIEDNSYTQNLPDVPISLEIDPDNISVDETASEIYIYPERKFLGLISEEEVDIVQETSSPNSPASPKTEEDKSRLKDQALYLETDPKMTEEPTEANVIKETQAAPLKNILGKELACIKVRPETNKDEAYPSQPKWTKMAEYSNLLALTSIIEEFEHPVESVYESQGLEPLTEYGKRLVSADKKRQLIDNATSTSELPSEESEKSLPRGTVRRRGAAILALRRLLYDVSELRDAVQTVRMRNNSDASLDSNDQVKNLSGVKRQNTSIISLGKDECIVRDSSTTMALMVSFDNLRNPNKIFT